MIARLGSEKTIFTQNILAAPLQKIFSPKKRRAPLTEDVRRGWLK